MFSLHLWAPSKCFQEWERISVTKGLSLSTFLKSIAFYRADYSLQTSGLISGLSSRLEPILCTVRINSTMAAEEKED